MASFVRQKRLQRGNLRENGSALARLDDAVLRRVERRIIIVEMAEDISKFTRHQVGGGRNAAGPALLQKRKQQRIGPVSTATPGNFSTMAVMLAKSPDESLMPTKVAG
jgi:hypothetical protein